MFIQIVFFIFLKIPLLHSTENSDIFNSKLTTVKLGENKITRRFDKSGNLVKRTLINPKMLLREELILKSPLLHEKKTWFESKLIRIENQFFLENGNLIRSEILLAPDKKNDFRNKITVLYKELNMESTYYEKINAQWKETSTKTWPAHFFNQNQQEDAFVSLGSSKTFEQIHQALGSDYNPYISCLTKRSMQSPDCISTSILDSQLKAFSSTLVQIATPFTDLVCVKGDELFLPSGPRIDLKTCSPYQINAIENALTQVTSSYFNCLKNKNIEGATKFALALTEKRPLIKCIPEGDFSGWLRNGCGGKSNCNESMAADYTTQTNTLQLIRSDPSVGISYSKSTFAALLFHEFLHAADFDFNETHNSDDPDLIDTVYGCQLLCAQEILKTDKEIVPGNNFDYSNFLASQEGCSSCIEQLPYDVLRSDFKTAEESKLFWQKYNFQIDQKRKQAQKFCKNYLPIDTSLKLEQAMVLHKFISICLNLNPSIAEKKSKEWKKHYCNSESSYYLTKALEEVCDMKTFTPDNQQKALADCRPAIQKKIYQWLEEVSSKKTNQTWMPINLEKFTRYYRQFDHEHKDSR